MTNKLRLRVLTLYFITSAISNLVAFAKFVELKTATDIVELTAENSTNDFSVVSFY